MSLASRLVKLFTNFETFVVADGERVVGVGHGAGSYSPNPISLSLPVDTTEARA
jgi:hypothetical protein